MPNAAGWLHGTDGLGIRTGEGCSCLFPAKFPRNDLSPQPGIPLWGAGRGSPCPQGLLHAQLLPPSCQAFSS